MIPRIARRQHVVRRGVYAVGGSGQIRPCTGEDRGHARARDIRFHVIRPRFGNYHRFGGLCVRYPTARSGALPACAAEVPQNYQTINMLKNGFLPA